MQIGYPPGMGQSGGGGSSGLRQRSWRWHFALTTCSATLNGDTLILKQGIRTRTTKVSRLRYLYVCRHENGHDELLLSYEKASGKNKTLRVYGNSGEAGMEAFVATLAGLRPGIDIRNLNKKAAYKTLGTPRTQWVVAVFAVVVVMAVVGVLALPLARSDGYAYVGLMGGLLILLTSVIVHRWMKRRRIGGSV